MPVRSKPARKFDEVLKFGDAEKKSLKFSLTLVFISCDFVPICGSSLLQFDKNHALLPDRFSNKIREKPNPARKVSVMQ